MAMGPSYFIVILVAHGLELYAKPSQQPGKVADFVIAVHIKLA